MKTTPVIVFESPKIKQLAREGSTSQTLKKFTVFGRFEKRPNQKGSEGKSKQIAPTGCNHPEV